MAQCQNVIWLLSSRLISFQTIINYYRLLREYIVYNAEISSYVSPGLKPILENSIDIRSVVDDIVKFVDGG